MHRLFILSFFLLINLNLNSQQFPWSNSNAIYQDYIKSVTFHISGLFTSVPIAKLDEPSSLRLMFDDLEGGYKRYKYTIIHCNSEWEPSNLGQMEYIDGFEEEEIRIFNYSLGTFQDYTNYQLFLPNEDFRYTISGNYLLHVYEDRGEIIPILTRRFMVVEQLVSASVEFQNPSSVAKMRSHQELDFKINFKNLRISNPKLELEVTILQNGRWDNALTGVTALYERDAVLIFDYQDEIVFEAGKEFRQVDLRSLKFRSEYVEQIERDRYGYFIYVEKEKTREFSRFTNEKDLNGRFIIANLDQADDDLQSEYVTVQFFLESAKPFDKTEVYLVGQLSDWQCREQFRMHHSQEQGGYIGEVNLKQGHYNYYYGLLPSGKSIPEFQFTEGNWHETSNEYTILTYYRPIGGRYDRLVGAQTVLYGR